MMIEALFVLLLVTQPSEAGSSPGDSPEWRVGLRGVGPVRFGMTLDQLRAVAGGFERLDGDGDYCFYVKPDKAPEGLTLMVVKGRVVRADVDAPTVKTLSGAAVGDTEARIHQIYPNQITTTDHAYTGGHYMYFEPADKQDQDFSLVFETDEGIVNYYRAGLLPQAHWMEGCS